MNLTDDLLSQITALPDWIQIMVGLTLFSIVWKKSSLPNRVLKYLNLILPAIAYPIIHPASPEMAQKYWNTWLILGLHGFGIGIISEFCHEGIVAKLKMIFPSFKFPDDTEQTKTTELKEETK